MANDQKDLQEQPLPGDGNPQIENDPEVLAEERRLRVRLLRLRYYKEVAGTIKVFLQTFKTEATSLVSGLGTLVLGYYQIKKWVLDQRRETTVTHSASGRSMARPEHLEVKIGKDGKMVVERKKPKATKPEPQLEARELVATAPAPEPTFVSDPMFYALIITGLAFGLTSGKLAWKKWRSNNDRSSTGGARGVL